jgi:hypothetical protein
MNNNSLLLEIINHTALNDAELTLKKLNHLANFIMRKDGNGLRIRA